MHAFLIMKRQTITYQCLYSLLACMKYSEIIYFANSSGFLKYDCVTPNIFAK